MNQALEDAVELAQAINRGGLTPDSLRAYESSRIPRVQEIMAAEMVCHHSRSELTCTNLLSALSNWRVQIPMLPATTCRTSKGIVAAVPFFSKASQVMAARLRTQFDTMQDSY